MILLALAVLPIMKKKHKKKIACYQQAEKFFGKLLCLVTLQNSSTEQLHCNTVNLYVSLLNK